MVSVKGLPGSFPHALLTPGVVAPGTAALAAFAASGRLRGRTACVTGASRGIGKARMRCIGGAHVPELGLKSFFAGGHPLGK